jgi:hypothetical protein
MPFEKQLSARVGALLTSLHDRRVGVACEAPAALLTRALISGLPATMALL